MTENDAIPADTPDANPPDAGTRDARPETRDASPHVVSAKVLVSVFAALLVLTVLTVAARQIDLGEFNIVLALAIAVLKAGLVALFFMHLFYDHLFNGVILIVAMLFVMLFISLALMDTTQYQPELRAYTQESQAPPGP
jgi:cytochrome c oxidase subunit IV